MRRTHGAVGGAVGVLLATLALGACDDEPPFPDPSESATLPTSPSPSESSSSPPEAESPEEFIRRWVEAQNEMLTSGDVDQYLTLSRGCGPCDDTARRVRDVYEQGGFIETDGWAVTSIARSGGQGRVVTYEVQIDNAPTRYAEKADGPLKTLEAGQPLMQLTVTRRASGFVVSDLTQLSTP